MKQTDVIEKVIGDAHFYIRPFPAFVAANISGDLAALVTPMLASLAPLFEDKKEDGTTEPKEFDIMNLDVAQALPAVSSAFSGLNGATFEKLMRKLLTDNGNISVECEATDNNVKLMDYDTANAVFCGEIQDMFILCFEVIRINFGSFFKKLVSRFGGLQGAIDKLTGATKNTANLT